MMTDNSTSCKRRRLYGLQCLLFAGREVRSYHPDVGTAADVTYTLPATTITEQQPVNRSRRHTLTGCGDHSSKIIPLPLPA